MTARKLQNEIDRTLKKVGEGVTEFEDTMAKVQNVTTSNQREKYEGDLKKEIKKLQRFRDQIKTWIASNDVKDKQPLIDARKLIESLMEQFRTCERESKTKAYSKEGLQATAKKQDSKSKMHTWFKKTLEELDAQLNKYQCELERIDGDTDPDVFERSITLEHLVDRHKFHITALEKIQRAWDNHLISTESIDKMKEGLEEYLTSNQEPDFYENEDLYDECGIELRKLLGGDKREESSSTETSEAKREDPSVPTKATLAPPAPVIINPVMEAAVHTQTNNAKEAKLPKPDPVSKGGNKSGPPSSPARGNGAQPPARALNSGPPSSPSRSSGWKKPGGRPQAAETPAPQVEHPPLSDARQACLEASLRFLPGGVETNSDQEQYIPRNPYPTPPYYPDQPLALFEQASTFEKLDTDTLFFIFYYHQGTYQQFLAARELKKRSWRYHKKYLTWFQRHEEPKEITADYEQGTYVYFDYETGWCQRKKTEFTFEYRFLEDGD